MAEFFKSPNQDPDAIRRAMVLKMFGAAAAGGQPAGVPPNSMMNPTKPVNMTPTGDAPSSAQPGAPGTAGSVEGSTTPRATPLTAPTTSPNDGPPTATPITAAAATSNT